MGREKHMQNIRKQNLQTFKTIVGFTEGTVEKEKQKEAVEDFRHLNTRKQVQVLQHIFEAYKSKIKEEEKEAAENVGLEGTSEGTDRTGDGSEVEVSEGTAGTGSTGGTEAASN